MLSRHFVQSVLCSSITTILVLALLSVASAQVRTSNSYQLQSDSINIGGGFSSSTNYIQESTVGEIATGESTSITYSLHAGYQQMQEVYISLSTTGDVIMDTDIGGLSGGTSNGSSTFTVITDSPSGYQLTLQAENNPAMQSPLDTIADYDPGGTPSFSFPIAAGEAFLGFTAEGVDQAQAFYDNAGTCNSGSTNTPLACWDGLSTSAYTIAQGTGSNHPDGATTTAYFRVRVGNGANLLDGVYTATTTVTALPL